MTVSTKILRSTTDFNVDDNFTLLLFWAYETYIFKKKLTKHIFIPNLLKGSVNSIEYKSSYIYITNIFIIVFSFHRNAIIIQSQCLFICSQWV